MKNYTLEQAMKDYYDEIMDEAMDTAMDTTDELADEYEMYSEWDEYEDYDPEAYKALDKFYDEHIKGKEYPEGLDSYALYSFAHKMWRELDPEHKYSYLYDFARSEEFLAVAVEEFGFSKEELVFALNLSEAYGTYSDWYKDLNGVRPRCY
jgi:hypothetical protein